MATRLNPYLSFQGNAREAMEFYKGVFGGKLDVSTFGEGGMPHDPSEANKIMHAQLEADNGMTLMASDTAPDMPSESGSAISCSLSGDDEAELSGYYQKLSDGGSIDMPLEKAPWGDQFGMLTDKYGVHWLVNIAGTPAA